MSLRSSLAGCRDRLLQSIALLGAFALVLGLLLLAMLVWVMKGVTEEAAERRLAEARQAQLDWLCTAPGTGDLSADCTAASLETTGARTDGAAALVRMSLQR